MFCGLDKIRYKSDCSKNSNFLFKKLYKVLCNDLKPKGYYADCSKWVDVKEAETFWRQNEEVEKEIWFDCSPVDVMNFVDDILQ